MSGSTTRSSRSSTARPLVVASTSSGSPGRHIVATTHSVMPNAGMTSSKESSLSIRSISRGGMLAAPMLASRRDEVSVVGNDGDSSREWKTVGAPGTIVSRSDSIRASAASASKAAIG